MLRCALYLRLSIDRLEEAESVDRQEETCRALVAARGGEVVEVFTERDVSAYSRTARPQFELLLAGLASGRFNAVAVAALDRLTRRYSETGRILLALEEAGATLLSAREAIDTSSPMGQAIVGFVIAQAETESRNTSLRVRSAADAAARRGEAHSGGSRTFGYTRAMEIVPAEAAVGREMAERVAKGESLRQVAFSLNERSVKTTQGKEWHASRVGQWLRSAKPAGIRSHNGVETVGTWPAILEPELRLQVMGAIAARGPTGRQSTKPSHLLAGFVWCGACGGRLKTMGFRLKDGRPFPRYQCVKTPAQVNCGKVAATLVGLDAHVTSEFLAFLSRSELRPLPDARRGDELAALVEADGQALVELTRARFVDRVLTAEQFETSRRELQERLDQGTATLAAWERETASADGALRPAALDDLREWWTAATLEDRRAALSHAVVKVHVDPAARRGGNVFDTSRVRIDWTYSLYMRAGEHFMETATDEELERGRKEYERLNREG